MADNFIANPGAGGDTFSADDVGGVKYPYSKIDAGGDGVSVPIIAGQKTMSASLPVALASDQSALTISTHAVTQSGTWTVILGAGASAVGSVSVSNAAGASAVNVQDGGNSLTVDGTVAATQSGTWNIGSITTLPTLANVTTVGTVTNVTNWFPSVISAVNSSTANLGISGVFTGTSEDVSNFADIQIYVFANQVSATDGLSLQQSSDGTNWDVTDTYTIAASTGKTFSVQPAGRFFRVVYTNGGVAQTAFRLQITYHRVMAKPSSQRPMDGLSNESDLEEVQAWNMLFNGTTWDRARGDATNGMFVQVKSAPTSSGATLSNVAGSATSVTVLAANAARKGATIQNDSSAILYVKFGTTASTTSYTIQMAANSYYEVPFAYTGRIDGIWASATGNARVTELT